MVYCLLCKQGHERRKECMRNVKCKGCGEYGHIRLSCNKPKNKGKKGASSDLTIISTSNTQLSSRRMKRKIHEIEETETSVDIQRYKSKITVNQSPSPPSKTVASDAEGATNKRSKYYARYNNLRKDDVAQEMTTLNNSNKTKTNSEQNR